MGTKKAFTSEERKRLFNLRRAGKQGHYVSLEDMKFLERCYQRNPEEYREIGRDAFEATKPYGAA